MTRRCVHGDAEFRLRSSTDQILGDFVDEKKEECHSTWSISSESIALSASLYIVIKDSIIPSLDSASRYFLCMLRDVIRPIQFVKE